MAIKMDGKALAEKMRAQIREEVAGLSRRPTLAVILVGEDPASQVYVRNKEKDCVECGILSGKLPGLDCVSIGPNLLDIHTPRERMEIASVQRVWRFVLEVLKRSK